MSDPSVPLFNLLILRNKMDNLHRFLSRSVNHNAASITAHQQQIISAEIASVIHDIISNGAALLSSCQTLNLNPNDPITNPIDLKVPAVVGNSETVGKVPDPKSNANFPGAPEEKFGEGYDMDIVELDAMELLAEHVHFCEICGKGFKRDANLRMHMRAHGNQYKTPEALVKPKNDPPESGSVAGKSRFSCPFSGCNRNKAHKKFRPLKSATCVKNHFKRSHCPKMFSCHKCNKKSFSVVADLKSHLKNCGECRWQCCCGTSFSRKDKLFGHMALFEGHMPAVTPPEESKVAEGVDDASGFFEDFEATMEGVCFDGIAGDDLFEPGFSFPGLDPSDDSFLSCMRGTNNIRIRLVPPLLQLSCCYVWNEIRQ